MTNKEIRAIEEEIGYIGTRNLSELMVSEHAVDRYAERFKDIDDKATRGVYVEQHKDEIRDFIKKTFQYAELIYVGDLSKNGKSGTCYYFLNGDIALIYDPGSKCVITIFRIKFDVPDENVSGVIIESYRKAIAEKQEELFELVDERARVQAISESVIGCNKTKIAELQEQIKILENENSIREQQVSIMHSKVNQTRQLMKGLANKLFGMSDFKVF